MAYLPNPLARPPRIPRRTRTLAWSLVPLSLLACGAEEPADATGGGAAGTSPLAGAVGVAGMGDGSAGASGAGATATGMAGAAGALGADSGSAGTAPADAAGAAGMANAPAAGTTPTEAGSGNIAGMSDIAGAPTAGSDALLAGAAGAEGVAGQNTAGSEGEVMAGAPSEMGGAANEAGASEVGGNGMDEQAGAGMDEEPSGDGVACPADATFCSGFESTTMPEGAVYNRNAAPAEWDADFVVDTAQKYAGNSSLRVKTLTEEAQSAYKMLAVPAPGPVFWVRAFMRGSSELGAGPSVSDGQHNRLMVATNGSDTNTTDALEIADDCGFALNSHDSVYRAEGNGGTCDSPLRLAANEWHCVEVSFNGQTGDTQVYINGELKIDAVGWEPGKGNFTHLKFGVDHLHAIDRSVWYDDIAVGPTRPGCY